MLLKRTGERGREAGDRKEAEETTLVSICGICILQMLHIPWWLGQETGKPVSNSTLRALCTGVWARAPPAPSDQVTLVRPPPHVNPRPPPPPPPAPPRPGRDGTGRKSVTNILFYRVFHTRCNGKCIANICTY